MIISNDNSDFLHKFLPAIFRTVNRNDACLFSLNSKRMTQKPSFFFAGDIFPRFRLGRKLQFCGSGAVNEPQGIERATGGNLTGKTERILGASQNLKQRLGFVVARREKNRLFCRQRYAGQQGDAVHFQLAHIDRSGCAGAVAIRGSPGNKLAV